MSGATDNRPIRCRTARAGFRALAAEGIGTTEQAALRWHLDECTGCASEYRLYSLGFAALNAAASSETITPDKDFFVALRARIARGPAEATFPKPKLEGDESWAAALLLTARQLIPALAVLLALIIGANFVWLMDRPESEDMRPSERIMFGEVYGYPGPTAEDVLETLVAVEDREDGR